LQCEEPEDTCVPRSHDRSEICGATFAPTYYLGKDDDAEKRFPGGRAQYCANQAGGQDLITVLIVDSQRMVAESLAAVLSVDGDISVIGSEQTCAGAERVAVARCPDVVLLEQVLSDGLGTDSVKALLSNPGTRVLMVTADTSDTLLARAVAAGAAGVISKQKSIAELLTTIRAVARDEAVITPAALRRLLVHLARVKLGPGADLTAREREVLALLVAGKSTASLAAELFVSPATARNHIQSIMNKLGAHSRLEAVSITMRNNILDSAA